MTTRSMSDLEKRIEDTRSETNLRMDQMQVAFEGRFDELRTLITQIRGLSQDSNNSPPRPRPVEAPVNGVPVGRVVHTDPPPVRNYSTRLSKVEFPRFDGKKVKDWLYKCDQFFLLDETPPESRVRLASIHLEGLALQWHLNYMRGRFDQYPLWQQYAVDVKRRFGDLYEDPLAELIQVKHSNSVQNYIDEFELAHTQVTILPEQALSIFLAGLEPSTQAQVRMFNPANLAHAANLARLCESAKPKHNTSKQPYQTPKTQTQATKNGQPPLLPNPSQKSALNRTSKSLSRAQVEERSAKGLCWYCDEPYTPGHHLKHRGPSHQIMVMEAEDEVEESESIPEPEKLEPVLTPVDPEIPQISMQAMTGSSNYQTMRASR